MIYNFWTDGAATMKKDDLGNYIREAGGWAWALVCDNNIVKRFDAGYADNTTNNEMELKAIQDVLSYYMYHRINRGDIINIYSDSAYCVNIFTQWIDGWRINNWTRKGNKLIENLNLIKDIYTHIANLKNHFVNVNFIKVKGHSNDMMNDFVDRLAVAAKTNNLTTFELLMAIINKSCERGLSFNGEYIEQLKIRYEAKIFCLPRGIRAKTSIIDDIGPDRETIEKILEN